MSSLEASHRSSSDNERIAERLRTKQEQVLALWERRMRAEVPAARAEHAPILINTLPALLANLAEAISPAHARVSATDGSTVAEEHGGERVRLTQFRLEDVIAEYRLLREVLLDVLEEDESLTNEARLILHGSIDQAMTQACTAYVLVQEGLREERFAVLAHDLRGPLTTASASLAMIERKPSSEHVPRWAQRAAEGIRAADRMVSDLLDAMRIHIGGRLELDLELCDLMEVVRHAVDHLASQFGDRFVIVGPDALKGHFSPDAMRRAVTNLANNAVKYGATDKPVSISVRVVYERVIIEVHNEGSYIPVEQQESIFRAFHRTRSAEQSKQPGWGLGLAQVRGVAEAHGGSIGVDSLPDSGTTFVIDIPADARPFQCKPMTP